MSGLIDSPAEAQSRRDSPLGPEAPTPPTLVRPRAAFLGLGAIAIYVVVGLVGLPPGPWGDSKQGPLVLIVCLYPLIGSVIAHRLRTGESYVVAWQRVVTRRSLLSLAGLALASQVFFAAFMAWKGHLPQWGHFWADPMLADLDARLHAGRDAWILLGPLTTTRVGLVALDFIYHTWLPALCLMMGWRAWAQDYRFFFAFALCWIILGTGLALVLHSAGPIFAHATAGTGRYAELLTHLASVRELRTHETYSTLWAAYSMGYPSSISAFPSMHMAMPTLWALACPPRLPRLRLALWIYAALIGVSAIGLGWHYAIDIYAAIPGVWLCWWIAGRLFR